MNGISSSIPQYYGPTLDVDGPKLSHSHGIQVPSAAANPRAAAIAYQCIYELQLPYVGCPGHELSIIDDMGTFARGVTPADFGLDARGMAPSWSPPR